MLIMDTSFSKMVTIFTPTYNRVATIPRLFMSLCDQPCKDFEWLIVDDGSSDGTEELVRGFERFEEFEVFERFPIRYFKQENGGKHRAINRGVREAKGELFFIVDSDDQLTPDAVEWILAKWRDVKDEVGDMIKDIAGISGLRIHPDGTKIGGGEDFGMIEADAIEIRNKYHVKGDLAEIYRTDVLRQYPFPDFPGEKFCSEGLIWGRIAEKFKLRYFYKGIYVCQYLEGGLTDTRYACRINSPNYSMLLYSELIRHPNSLLGKVAYALNFWRFGAKSKKSFWEKCRQIGFPWYLLAPVGWLMAKRLKG